MKTCEYVMAVFRPYLFSFWITAGLFLAPSSQADYLPDAAAHLGTIFINHDDQFAVNPLVTLDINAVDTGSGIAQMQFSTDDQNWSAPEAYATNLQWQISIDATDYPPLMNTVLKTVYVRVKYGNGTWSKAFSDGIIFAKSIQDVPQITEVWIMQQRPSNYDSHQPQGSALNPYIVPAGANEPAFDSLMNSLTKTYVQYQARQDGTGTVLPAMNTVPVMFLHIGPGTFLTHGDNNGHGNSLSWSPTVGGRIKGAGKNATILKLVGGNTNSFAHVVGNFSGTGVGVYDNLELSDFTVDANMHEGGNTTSSWLRTGITLVGNNLQLRRLRVKGFGSRIPGLEPGGLTGHNGGLANLYNFHVEDCEIIAPQTINKYNPLMIGYQGGSEDINGLPYYMINVVIRNNYVNGLDYDQATPIDPYSSSFFERGTHGITLGACKNSVIEDNFIEHTMSGYYNDSFDVNDIVVRNNHFRDVIAGINFGTGAASQVVFTGNLVELDPHYYTTPVAGQTAPSDYGWRAGVMLNEPLRAAINHAVVTSNVFQFTDGAAPAPPLTDSFASINLSGSADIENNTTLGLHNTTIKWFQGPRFPTTFYDQQVDVIDPAKPTPVVVVNNHREDGTIIESYPYVLDKTLPRPVVVPNQLVSFPAPLINGTVPAMAAGLPLTNVIDASGVFNWTPTENDIGRYVVSFYDSVNRTNDPRRTLITVQNGYTNQDRLLSSAGLRGYWKLGEDIGSVFLDSSGNGNHLAISSTAANYLARGVPGVSSGTKALHFENTHSAGQPTLIIQNTNAQLIGDFPFFYDPILQRSTLLTRPFTISYWFKPDHQPNNFEAIFNYGSHVICGVTPGPQTNASLVTAFCYYGKSSDLTLYQGRNLQNVNILIGQWHHQVFTYDGLATKVYVDDVMVAQVPCGQIEDFDIGDGIYLGGGWGGDNYLGSLSNLAVWDYPLSDDEIANLYASQKQGPSAIVPPANIKATP